MKKKLAAVVAAVAMMATSAASIGCVWVFMDEPKTLKSFND
jgi:cyclic lactone autoinducer peptide